VFAHVDDKISIDKPDKRKRREEKIGEDGRRARPQWDDQREGNNRERFAYFEMTF
jgi:hypothetical protein